MHLQYAPLLGTISTSNHLCFHQVQTNFPEVAKSGPAARVVFNIIDRTSPIDPLSNEGEMPPVVYGDITLDRVTFAYPTRPDAIIFRNFSLKVAAGMKMALVGSLSFSVLFMRKF